MFKPTTACECSDAIERASLPSASVEWSVNVVRRRKCAPVQLGREHRAVMPCKPLAFALVLAVGAFYATTAQAQRGRGGGHSGFHGGAFIGGPHRFHGGHSSFNGRGFSQQFHGRDLGLHGRGFGQRFHGRHFGHWGGGYYLSDDYSASPAVNLDVNITSTAAPAAPIVIVPDPLAKRAQQEVTTPRRRCVTRPYRLNDGAEVKVHSC
jgi:hypothetical protein